MVRKALTVHTCNVQGLSTRPDKIQLHYQELAALGAFVLTETNLTEEKLQSSDHEPPPHIVARTTRAPERGEGTGSGVTLLLDAELVKGAEETFYAELEPGYLSRAIIQVSGHTYLLYGVYAPPCETRNHRKTAPLHIR